MFYALFLNDIDRFLNYDKKNIVKKIIITTFEKIKISVVITTLSNRF